MAFNFLDKVGRKKNKDFSDDKIDKFVKYLKNGSNQTEEEDEFDYENAQLPAEFNIPDDSSMKFLWNRFKDSLQYDVFDPLEFMKKPLLEAHYNFCKKNPDMDPDKLDENEYDLLEFIGELQMASLHFCEQIVKENSQRRDDSAVSKPDPVDSEVIIKLSKNKVRAWIYIVPPRNGGKEISAFIIDTVLRNSNITHGIVKGLKEKIVEEKLYFKIIEIARGSDPINGRDGYVEELFSRDKCIDLREDANGNVNYKELNLIKSIKCGGAICKITLPTKSVSGRAVDGSVVMGTDGEFPDVPKGENTSYSEDGTLLVADIGGEVVFSEGLFHVRRLLIVEHDVDNSVGNIDFTGDILIKGGVREGFSVKTDGNIKIEGTVEGAQIISGGNILIERGMTGGNKGYMEAGGTIDCIYLENCHVYAKGTITVEQVMYSEIASDDSIIITGGKGSAIGGKIIAGRVIEAKTIGARANSYLKTQIILGVTPSMIKEEKLLKSKFDDIEKNILRLTQNINYIEKNIKKATPERLDMLEEFKAQLQVRNLQKINTAQHLDEIRNKITTNTEVCRLKCNELYPIVIININGSNYVVDDELVDCSIFRKDDKSYLTSANLGKTVSF
ncbi:MAG: DUF342 domain-containing protein [Porcipelethomonas sp.]